MSFREEYRQEVLALTQELEDLEVALERTSSDLDVLRSQHRRPLASSSLVQPFADVDREVTGGGGMEAKWAAEDRQLKAAAPSDAAMAGQNAQISSSSMTMFAQPHGPARSAGGVSAQRSQARGSGSSLGSEAYSEASHVTSDWSHHRETTRARTRTASATASRLSSDRPSPAP